MSSAVLAIGLALVGVGALAAGPAAFAVVVLAGAVAVLVDLSLLLAGAGARPVIPVALIPGLVLPAMVAADVAVDPAAGWDRIPGAFAVAVIVAFVLVLAFGRRDGAVAGLAATATVSLLVGLGATSLLLLRGLPDGRVWMAVLLALLIAADAAGPLLRWFQGRRSDGLGRDPGQDDVGLPPRTLPLAGVLPGLVAVAVVVGVLLAVLEPPFGGVVLSLLAAVAVVSALGGGYLHRALAVEAGTGPGIGETRLGEGLLFGILDGALIAAPAAYVLVRSVAL